MDSKPNTVGGVGVTADDDDIEIRKSSTMNSMYIGSTISKPNVESIINAVATILHSQMLEVGAAVPFFVGLVGLSQSMRVRPLGFVGPFLGD